MLFDGFHEQTPDVDPEETDEWVQSFAAVVEETDVVIAGDHRVDRVFDEGFELGVIAVSYTHLTLPTNREV